MLLSQDNLPRQGFGAMRLRDESSGDPDRDPGAVINRALDAGVAMVDTADAYGNEALVGRAISGRRDEDILASKFGLVWGEGGDWSVRADAAYVRRACEASLGRLEVEVIDLDYLHHRSDETPIEETVAALAGLVAEGQGPHPGAVGCYAGRPPAGQRRTPDHCGAGGVVTGASGLRAAASHRPRARGDRSCALADRPRTAALAGRWPLRQHGARSPAVRPGRHGRESRGHAGSGRACLGAPPVAALGPPGGAAARHDASQPSGGQHRCRRDRSLRDPISTASTSRAAS